MGGIGPICDTDQTVGKNILLSPHHSTTVDSQRIVPLVETITKEHDTGFRYPWLSTASFERGYGGMDHSFIPLVYDNSFASRIQDIIVWFIVELHEYRS